MAIELKLLLHMNTSVHLGSLGTTYSQAIPDWSEISKVHVLRYSRVYFMPMRCHRLIRQVYCVNAT